MRETIHLNLINAKAPCPNNKACDTILTPTGIDPSYRADQNPKFGANDLQSAVSVTRSLAVKGCLAQRLSRRLQFADHLIPIGH